MACMTPDEIQAWRVRHRAAARALQKVQDDDLVGMSNEEALRRLQLLTDCSPWRERADWSGLVEQQAIFMRARKK